MNLGIEIKKIQKNKVFQVMVTLIIIYYIVNLFWTSKNWFEPNLENVKNVAMDMGFGFDEEFIASSPYDIFSYGCMYGVKTSFLYPIYSWGCNFLFVVILVTTLDCYNDGKYKTYQTGLVYTNRFQYYGIKAAAMAINVVYVFIVLGLLSEVVSLFVRSGYANDEYGNFVFRAIDHLTSWDNVLRFLLGLIVIFLVSFIFCFCIYALFHLTDIPFVGLMVVAFSIPGIGELSKIMLPGALAALYAKLMPFEEMGLDRFVVTEAALGGVLMLYFWLLLILGIGLLCLKARKYRIE